MPPSLSPGRRAPGAGATSDNDGRSQDRPPLLPAVSLVPSYHTSSSINVQRGSREPLCVGNQCNLWITSPERNLGSNQVVLGGMMLPVSAISISCFMETG